MPRDTHVEYHEVQKFRNFLARVIAKRLTLPQELISRALSIDEQIAELQQEKEKVAAEVIELNKSVFRSY